ncbi:MAG: type II secretion system major pseudopilin GspG [Verrucomicrobiota bacterium]
MKKQIQSRSSARRGFSLIEIMLVLGIIAVLLGAVIKLTTGNLDAAKVQRVEADIQTVTTQLRTYEMLNLFMPTTEQGIQALVTSPQIEPMPRQWRQLLTQLPLDPWGMPYQYRNPGKHNPASFDLFSTGPDKVESADDIGNWTK